MEAKLIIALLVLAHLIADFLLQSKEIVEGKRKNIKYLVLHIVGVWGISILLTIHYLTLRLLIIELLIAFIHFIIDYTKIILEKSDIRIFNQLRLFCLDQLLHLIIIISAYPWLGRLEIHNWAVNINKLLFKLFPFYQNLNIDIQGWYLMVIILSGYIFIWVPASFMVYKTLVNFKYFKTGEEKKIGLKAGKRNEVQNGDDNLPNPGELIGKLERFVLLTLVLSKSFAAIPVIFAIKSIVRFNNFNNKDFANYYIIGTSVSLLTAMGVGLFLNLIIYMEGYGSEFILCHIF